MDFKGGHNMHLFLVVDQENFMDAKKVKLDK